MLSVTSQYALRALAQLAKNRKHRSMLGKDLAEKAEIPPNYLAKILLSLKNAGVLGTARGSRGGYWLVRDPEDIKLMEIVQLFDQMLSPQPCILGEKDSCSPDDSCLAHAKWHQIRMSYLEFLQGTSIADLATTGKKVVAQNGLANGTIITTNA